MTEKSSDSGSVPAKNGMDDNRTQSILQSIAAMKSSVANNAIKTPLPKKTLSIITREPNSLSSSETERAQSSSGSSVTTQGSYSTTSKGSMSSSGSSRSKLAPGNLRNASNEIQPQISTTPGPISSVAPSSITAAGVKRRRPIGKNRVIVSPRQKGNKVLEFIRNVPWEWGDITADYVTGTSSCVLFLSLKYHRLHPEYIHIRMSKLNGRGESSSSEGYQLRVLLVVVDIENHADSLKELTKISLLRDFTIVLAWNAEEAGTYISQLKIMEAASAQAIQGQVTEDYEARLLEVMGKVRGVNKNDAVSLVSQYGSLKNAISDGGSTLESVGGWGGVKVKRFREAVTQPFIYNKQYPDREE